jgi:aquaglyceroporin related protein
MERGAETPEVLADQDYYTRYPNNWAKIRSAMRCRSQSPVAYGPHRDIIREPAAEMLGTMILTLFGTAGNCQVVLSANTGVASSPKGDYLSLAIGWACGQSIFFFLPYPWSGTSTQVLVWVLGSLVVSPEAT